MSASTPRSTPPGQPDWIAFLPEFGRRNILVVGDMMLDRFIWGRVNRISPEAPVPVVEVERESVQPGGASNVVNNLVALGAHACMVGVVGGDAEGRQLRDELARAGADVSGVLVETDGVTTVKTRIVAHSQQLVRVDRERGSSLSAVTQEQLRESAARETGLVDAVVFSDYDKGVMSQKTVEAVRVAAAARGIPVVANPKPRNLDLLRGITAISLNHSEAEQAVGWTIGGDPDVRRAGETLLHRLETAHVLITLGGHGLALFSQGAEPFFLPAAEVPVYDVAGAGDTVISAFAMALSCGADARAAADLANLAAGAVVRKVGVATASVEEILLLHRELQAAAS